MAAQRSDDQFKIIINYLEEGVVSSDETVARRTVAESQFYILDDKILFQVFQKRSKKPKHDDNFVKQLAIPMIKGE